jgi:hypothetical protein
LSIAALRLSSVSAFGSRTPAGSLTRRLRSKFLSAAVKAAAGAVPWLSFFSTTRRLFVHL